MVLLNKMSYSEAVSILYALNTFRVISMGSDTLINWWLEGYFKKFSLSLCNKTPFHEGEQCKELHIEMRLKWYMCLMSSFIANERVTWVNAQWNWSRVEGLNAPVGKNGASRPQLPSPRRSALQPWCRTALDGWNLAAARFVVIYVAVLWDLLPWGHLSVQALVGPCKRIFVGTLHVCPCKHAFCLVHTCTRPSSSQGFKIRNNCGLLLVPAIHRYTWSSVVGPYLPDEASEDRSMCEWEQAAELSASSHPGAS